MFYRFVSRIRGKIILLNILTEGPAVDRLAQKIKKDICITYPEIKRVLEFDKLMKCFMHVSEIIG